MDAEKTDGIKTVWEEVPLERVTDFIRKKSRAGQFTGREDILEELARQSVLNPQQKETSEVLDTLLSKTLEENEDVKQLSLKCGGPRYYSSQFMTGAFVKILLRKEENPLLLLAEAVREHSQVYPRPVPLDAFNGFPFNLTQEEILACLQQMTEAEEYKDIQRTATSVGNVFLYSTLHLDPDYASMLAEWFDVGQYDNP